MKYLKITPILFFVCLSVMGQSYLNIRLNESSQDIRKELGETKESGFVNDMQYRSHFYFDDDSICFHQRTLFVADSITIVESLLINMNFVKHVDGTYFARNNDNEIVVVAIDPDVITVDSRYSFVMVDIFKEEEEEE